MPFNYDSSTYDSPELDVNVQAAIDAAPSIVQPVANRNASSGFSFDNAINGVLGLLDNGLNIYNKVSDTIGTAQAQAQAKKTNAKAVTISPNNPSFVFGLSTTQILLIAGGLAALLIIPRLVKR